MIFKGKIKDGKIYFENPKLVKWQTQKLEQGEVSIEVTKWKKQRSDKQNRALHLWYGQLAKAMNENGFDMRAVIKEDIDLTWSSYSVKESLWRPVQKQLFGKKSTKSLTTEDINAIYDIINKVVGERTGLHVPFPSIETLLEE